MPQKLFDGDKTPWVLLVHADGERGAERVGVASDTGAVGDLLDAAVQADVRNHVIDYETGQKRILEIMREYDDV